MSLIDRVLVEPEFRDAPPVLVDVGAAGGVPAAWRRIARHAVGVGFEPDTREAAPLARGPAGFRRWIYCPTLVVPAAPADGRQELHLTRSPQCSSTLRPRVDALREWLFADFFAVTETRRFPASTLEAALTAQGVTRIDWLKCDTQGLDLGIYRSLPPAWRERLLVAEFEPGIIAAYEGEDRVPEVLAAMADEPFWLAELRLGRTVRGRPEVFGRHLGPGALRWARRLAPGSPAWANLTYLRDVERTPAALDRRALLLAWVCATLMGQPGGALAAAETGAARFGEDLFGVLARASARSLRWSLVRGAPGWLWRRLTGTG
ncbi:MAG: hypothetical protein JNG83_04240 [Opitutaceae bacterium]|nr:hypothetical protein [Opitutaceae bacterium]